MITRLNTIKIKSVFLNRVIFLAVLIAASPVLSQTRPPNDDLTNATVLTGTDVTFGGSLAGATMEGSPYGTEAGFYVDAGGRGLVPNGSIWWSWTAPVSTILNLQVNPFPGPGYIDVLNVFLTTNEIGAPNGLHSTNLLGSLVLDGGSAVQWLSIPVIEGNNYFFQLIGVTSNAYSFRLRATNAPLILKQPLSQTVYSNGSAIFYVESAGYGARTFQWLFNGTNMPGETTPILALDHIDSAIAGNYSVWVSNADGAVLSDYAVLAISQSNVAPVLEPIVTGSNSMSFHLLGELGRAYHIESSINLVDWQLENGFLRIPQINPGNFPGYSFYPIIPNTNLVYATNLPLTVTVSNNAPKKFYRASIYKSVDPNAEICINNLKQVLIAKQLWRREYKISSSATPTYHDLLPYYAHFTNLFCPDDPGKSYFTSYIQATLATFPGCLAKPDQHILEGTP